MRKACWNMRKMRWNLGESVLEYEESVLEYEEDAVESWGKYEENAAESGGKYEESAWIKIISTAVLSGFVPYRRRWGCPRGRNGRRCARQAARLSIKRLSQFLKTASVATVAILELLRSRLS